MAGAATVEALERALALATSADEPLLVGVSGGSDSVALMGLAARARPGRVAVVHVDHGVRAEAAAEAAFVAGLAGELGLPCHVERAAPPAVASETALRTARLAVLERVAVRLGARCVLLAHHGDDTRETILLHAWRGHRGLRARAGMPAQRPLGARAVLLRPWLLRPCPPGRAALAAAREQLGLPHVEDAMNAEPRIPRTRMRALLAQGRHPLTHEYLELLRHTARRELQWVLFAATHALERSLHPEGRGVRLERDAFNGLEQLGVSSTTWRAELLRLLGACLEPAWQPQLRRTVLDEFGRRLAADGRPGDLDLPGRPAAQRARLGPAGLHLLDARLLDGEPLERSLVALGRLPLP